MRANVNKLYKHCFGRESIYLFFFTNNIIVKLILLIVFIFCNWKNNYVIIFALAKINTISPIKLLPNADLPKYADSPPDGKSR